MKAKFTYISCKVLQFQDAIDFFLQNKRVLQKAVIQCKKLSERQKDHATSAKNQEILSIATHIVHTLTFENGLQ